MHKFIYPSKDTYINNSDNYIDKNFGNDEVLEIYASNQGKKTIYATLNWLPIPETSQSYGYEGAMAYSTSSVYIYSGSLWRQFSITNDIINSSSYISNFTGKFTNVQTSPYVQLYLDGTSTYASGSFSGSYVFNSTSYVNGLFTSGSFSGSVEENSTFSKLIVNGIEYTTSPLTSSLTGTGSFINFLGIVNGLSGTAHCPNGLFINDTLVAQSASFNGMFTSSNFNGYISSHTSSDAYYVDVINYSGFFKGNYTGSFQRPTTADYLITPEFSRTLLYFDVSELSQSIATNEISSSDLKIFLNLSACGARNLPMNYNIYAYPISQSWENGSGTYVENGSNFGASWLYRNYNSGSSWYGASTQSYEFSNYLTDSSNSTSAWINGGSTWYYNVPSTFTDTAHWLCNSNSFPSLENASLICSQSFSHGTQSDISMDITTIVRSWICGAIANEGIVLITSFELSVPAFNHTNGLLQFYSRETNTIYSPRIDVAWDDSVYETGSLSPITGSTENLINIRNLKEEIKSGSKPKIYVFSRDKYPLKQFNKSTQQPSHVTPKYLPTSSYYMIKDAESEEVLIDHDAYSKLSCDSTLGNYFVLDTTNLPQERYYTILIKTEYSNGTIDIHDTQKIFKISR
jgi:hypothetical protein